MFSEWQASQYLPAVILCFAFGFYVNRIDQRVKLINNRLGRLSLTFLKIENDLAAIQDSLLVMSQNRENASEMVSKIRDRRLSLFQFIVEQGPNRQEIMRGLEPPDIDDDPGFWADDRMKRFGFETNDDVKDET